MANARHSFVAFYASDWLAGTARLPRLHKSVFFDICCYIWDHNEPCPPMEAVIMVGDLPNGQEIIDQLVTLGKLDRHADGSLSNARALVEAGKSYDKWAAQSDGGKAARGAGKGADKSAGKLGRANRPQNQNQNQNQSPTDNPNPFAGEAWDGWIEMRVKGKKAPTERAIKQAIDKLLQLQAEGHDPEAVLDQSTFHGWTGLFPLKQERGGNGGKPSGWN